jgi:hypothetical protein
MNRVCSIFSQLLQLFSRVEFEAAVQQHKGERHARGFTCWGQFVAMLFCQLGRAHSLREICQGLASQLQRAHERSTANSRFLAILQASKIKAVARIPKTRGSLAFLHAETDTGLTFTSIAATARDQEKVERNLTNARRAYDSILRFIRQVEHTSDQKSRVEPDQC